MNIILIIFLLLMGVATFKMFLVYLAGVYKSYVSRKWPVVMGEIVDCYEKSIPFEGYKIIVEFKYDIGHGSYKSDTPYFGPMNLVDDTQNKYFLNMYKKGLMVKVYYNPENPDEATLITGVNALQRRAIAWVLLSFLFSLFFLSLAMARVMVSLMT